MACYVAFIPAETECSGCARPVPRGLAGFTDEIETPRLTPVCETCLHSLDGLLRGVLVIVRESGRQLRRDLADEALTDRSAES